MSGYYTGNMIPTFIDEIMDEIHKETVKFGHSTRWALQAAAKQILERHADILEAAKSASPAIEQHMHIHLTPDHVMTCSGLEFTVSLKDDET